MKLAAQSEIRPSNIQRNALMQHAGNARWTYNWALNRHKEAYQEWLSLGKPKKWKKWPNAISLHKELNLLKKVPLEEGGVPWMYEASKASPQEALRNLDDAFKRFFKGLAEYPKFKSRNKRIGGFKLTGTIKVTQTTIQLPRIGIIRLQPHERGYLPIGKYSQVSVKEKAGRWFVSVVNPIDIPEGKPNGGSMVGLDMGVARLATLSNGFVVPNPKALQNGQKKLKKLQRDMDRKKKGSMNRRKAKAKVARAHARVTNLRRDAQHKASTYLTKNHSWIAIEDLKIKNMTKKGGSRKRGLNRVMLDAALGEFRRQLEYKGLLNDCEIVVVPPHYTSQMCSGCGFTSKGNRVSQSRFVCLSCGLRMNADLNAAINIKRLGVAASFSETKNACGEVIRLDVAAFGHQAASMKQEPGLLTGNLSSNRKIVNTFA